MTSGESPIVAKLRAQGAHDGRSAGVRIDKVEAAVGRQDKLLVALAGGPDGVRAKLGDDERALAVLASAGYENLDPLRQRWAEERRQRERAAQQVTVRYSGDELEPDQDQRVLDAIARDASDAELFGKIIPAVRKEYADRARAEASRREDVADFMWTDQRGRAVFGNRTPVPVGVSTDPATGQPRQRTLVVNHAVPELGSEEVPPPDMRDIAAMEEMSRVCREHVPRQGEKFCPSCGKRRP